MTTNSYERGLLAEFVDSETYQNACHWKESSRYLLPNPYSSAFDCEALIRALNNKGWQVEIHWQHTSDPDLAAGAWIHIWQDGTEIHYRTDRDVDRWKHGLCDLALKAITGDTEEQDSL